MSDKPLITTYRAKSIKNTAEINKDMSQKALLSAYQQEIKKLKQQLEKRLVRIHKYCT